MKKLIYSLLIIALLATQSHAQQVFEEAVARAAGQTLKKAGAWIIALCIASGGVAVLAKDLEKEEAVYALQFQIDPEAIRRERPFGGANVFPVLIAQRTKPWVGFPTQYVIPEIFYNYTGGTIIWTFKLPKIPAGGSISVVILDDHSDVSRTWNNIIEKRWVTQLNPQTRMTRGIEANGFTGDKLQLLDPSITITGQKTLCKYSVTHPDTWFAREWHTEGSLVDGANREIGTVRFSQVTNK